MLRFVKQTIFVGQEKLTGESCALSDRKETEEMPTARKTTKQGRAKKSSTQTSNTKVSGTRVGTI